ncbi:amino acid ABC transporter substrate-binding protein (PAAT family) [Rhizobium sp. PP-F2F-G38]|uniref:ABC transporter substrate-binding protein n=1 Tax=Ferranicluibacter rubi TaxID=2715133 RepID=A0AA43ZD79_9HYPH|nr:ABC transporter substrate-binding protein [Ferranicluibacter rubi]NHT75669.1 ABC transporter substrate-binding protein [Ferranicluibacter rubi]PYE96081.1 amino acid ABC transporter substrate-binding protein (PAAT family) [Rhizobium sp. PP-F2F-G38]TCP88314.1 amino acid ABC transporter substrate-binding protein (PAAT family) [Rhizobium sp. PP-CC-2G-626]TCQ23021.1 amino acid ABC transporter substrate-binding protein (PAAT family) [Rhizobium sp. PP-CC-3G-465]
MKNVQTLMKAGLACVVMSLSAASALAAEGAAVKMVPETDIAKLPGVALSQTLADGLPVGIKKAGVLKVATDLTPPISFHSDEGKLVGIDADLAAALGVILGVEIQMTDVGAGAAIVPSILSKRFDISISGINDDPELQKQVDVIDYMFDATTIMTIKDNPLGIKDMGDLCGKKVAVPVGTFQGKLVEAASAKCATPIDIMSIPKMPDVLQAVRTGRADATVNGYATSVYTTANQTGKGKGLQALPDVRLAVGYLGMLTSKDNPELRDTVVAALQQMVDSGAYQSIMTKWGLGPLAVKTVKVNDAANMPVE